MGDSVEALWIICGFTLGVVVRSLLPIPGGGAGRQGAQSQELRDELDGLRLEWQDTLDKISHLYGRIRKRLPEDRPEAPMPAVQLNGKDAIRARAAAAGLWPMRR